MLSFKYKNKKKEGGGKRKERNEGKKKDRSHWAGGRQDGEGKRERKKISYILRILPLNSSESVKN